MSTKEYNYKYYHTHKEEAKRYGKAYREAHREELRLRRRAWGETHKREVSIYNKTYRCEHKEELKERENARRDERKDWRKTYHRSTRLNYLAEGFKWEDVEGYDGWKKHTHVHHRLEDKGFSKRDLVYYGFYFNCQPCDLICMSGSEHMKHHRNMNKETTNV